MTSLSRLASAALLATIASAATAAPTDYAFDSVSRFELKKTEISITGILRNTTTSTTVTWLDNGNTDFSYLVSRCVPVFLTMLEKSGRYYLNLTVDPAMANFQIISCGLELRN
jgi:hypothetical protein